VAVGELPISVVGVDSVIVDEVGKLFVLIDDGGVGVGVSTGARVGWAGRLSFGTGIATVGLYRFVPGSGE
jgi:hypothetical protein